MNTRLAHLPQKSLRALLSAGLIVLLALSASAAAQEPALVQDLTTSAPPLSTYLSGSLPQQFTDFQQLTFFRSWDEVHGRELWVSDGSEAGTRLFVDICPGACSSKPTNLLAIGDRLFFFADDGVVGHEPWVSDGTRAGTRLIEDLCPGACGWFRVESQPAGQRLIFQGEIEGQLTSARLLATSDGSAAGTQLLAEIERHHRNDDGPLLAPLGDVVLFGHDGQLWETDGTTAGTRPVFDFGESPEPETLVTIGDHVYFTYLGSLWASDGSGAGTKAIGSLVGLFQDHPSIGTAQHLVELDGKVYFIIRGNGCVLGRADRLAQSVEPVLQLPIPIQLRCPLEMVAHRGLLFVPLITGANGEEMWVSDGTAAGTSQLIESAPGFSGVAHSLTVLGEHVFWKGITRLWRSDGTSEGTAPIFDFEDAELRTHIEDMGIAHGRLTVGAFAGDLGDHIELWTSDGGPPTLLASPRARFGSSLPVSLLSLDDRVLYATRDDEARQLWTTRGLAGDAELFAAPAGADIHGPAPEAVAFGDRLAVNLGGLLLTDASGNDIEIESQVTASRLTAVGDTLFFAGLNEEYGSEPWRSNGQAAGTELLKDLIEGGIICCIAPPIDLSSYPSDLTPMADGRLLFTAVGVDRQLWISDGSAAGTEPLIDAQAGGPLRPTELTRLLARVLFAAEDDSSGRELWITNGTVAGTHLVADLAPGTASSDPTDLKTWGTHTYFVTGNPMAQAALWVTEGTADRTQKLRDLAPEGPATISDLTIAGGQLFFVASVAATGRELWVTDGTTGNGVTTGTRLVADLLPGPSSSSPRALTAHGRRLLFTASDGVHGAELWQSDGTAAGTVRLIDLNPGASSSDPSTIFSFGDRVLFTAARDDVGRELWSLELTNTGSNLGTSLSSGLPPGEP